MADLFAKFNCTYCQEEINGVRIQCCVCPDFDICLQCFSVGAEIGPHRNDHSYKFVDHCSVSIFGGRGSWTGKEQLQLLEAVELFGFGNWDRVSQHVGTRTSEEVKEEYIARYLHGNIGKATWAQLANHRPVLVDHVAEDDGPLSPTVTARLPPLNITLEEARLLGYKPHRDDYEREYNMEAEQLVSQLHMDPDEDSEIERALKLAMVDMYVRRLRERARRKRIVRDYQLVAKHFANMRKEPQKQILTKEQRDLREKMRVCSQFLSSGEHERLIASIERERELRHRLSELLKYRSLGLTTQEEIIHYEQQQQMRQHKSISNQKPLLNNKVNTYLNTEEGKAMFCIVHEFLEFCDLKFTLSVYEPESYLETKIHLEERQRIVEKLGMECDETRPILLHLLRSARAKSKSIEINLNMGSEVDQDKSTSEDKSDSLVRTMTVSDSDIIENKSLEPKTVLDEHKFNATFDLSSPTVDILKHPEKRKNLNTCDETTRYQNSIDRFTDKKSENKESTSDDTSNLLIDPASSLRCTNDIDKVPKITVSGSDDIFMTDKVSDIFKISPPKADKLKAKDGSNSMADLPPLQLNKSRVNDILPSLYSKEFKEKSNLRELDKLFEMEAEYEEDFIFDADDISLNSERSKVNLLDELQNATRNDSTESITLRKHDTHRSPNGQISENKTLFNHFGGSQMSTDICNSETNPE